MSRERRARAAKGAKSGKSGGAAGPPDAASASLTPRKRALFTAVAVVLPFAILALVEIGLRLFDRDGGDPLVVEAPLVQGDYVIVNPQVGARWFGSEANPPSARLEPFRAHKPDGALRVIALGESSTYGFPHAPSATFPRALQDMLQDVLPDREVEVVNLGIPATNSWTLRDIASEVLELSPDMVVIYTGHNEYYGALGVASTIGGGAAPVLVRTTLRVQRLRIVQWFRDLVRRVRSGGNTSVPDVPGEVPATFMETIANAEPIALNDASYRAGVEQFEQNLEAVVRRLADAGVPVLVGSLVSNLAGQAPLASDANDVPGGAREVYRSAALKLELAASRADSAVLLAEFRLARDLDVVRFRAPTAFDSVVMHVTRLEGVYYVPVRETFQSQATGGIPGNDLFVEHVHPTPAGYALMSHAFATAVRDSGHLPDADWQRLMPPGAYSARMHQTKFDSLLSVHTVRTVTSRWPFLDLDEAFDYRGSYVPRDGVDSLAFLVSRGGAPWLAAKLRLAATMMREGRSADAASELAGIVRVSPPVYAEPWMQYGEALLAAGQPVAADSALERAQGIAPNPALNRMRAVALVQMGDTSAAIEQLRAGARRFPASGALRYQLSLLHGLQGDTAAARREAALAVRVQSDLPGLREWVEALRPLSVDSTP